MDENKKPSGIENQIYETQQGVREVISKALGIIVGFTGMIGAFLVSLLRNPDGELGIKEKASDPWFWVMWGVIFVIVIAVVITTYKITKRDAKEKDKFVGAMMYYKQQKDEAMKNIDLLPYFCNDKNDEMFATFEREIVESSDMIYDRWKKDGYYKPLTFLKKVGYKIRKKPIPSDKPYLEKWQVKKIEEIKDIKIDKLRPRDLTQEYAFKKTKVYSFLPQDEKTIEKSFVLSTGVNRALNTFAFLLVGSLSFSFIGWVSATTNAIGVLMAWIGAIITGNEDVNGTLRSRIITKADLLKEFNTVVSKYYHLRKPIPVLEDDKKKDDKTPAPVVKQAETVYNEGKMILQEAK